MNGVRKELAVFKWTRNLLPGEITHIRSKGMRQEGEEQGDYVFDGWDEIPGPPVQKGAAGYIWPDEFIGIPDLCLKIRIWILFKDIGFMELKKLLDSRGCNWY